MNTMHVMSYIMWCVIIKCECDVEYDVIRVPSVMTSVIVLMESIDWV